MNSTAASLSRRPAAPVSELPAERKSIALIRQTVAAGMLALLLFGPIAFGAVEPWAVLVLEIGAALLFSLWVLQQYLAGQLEIIGHPLFAPAAAFALLILCQIVFRRSLYADATISQALKYVAYGILLFLGAQYARRRSDLKYLAMTLATFGFLMAVLAILQSFSSNGKLYWFHPVSSSNAVVFGSYANHNHYAGLMELLVPFPLTFALTGIWRGAKRTLWAFAAVIMASSLFLSQSRGGMVAFIVQLLFVGLLSLRRRSKTLPIALGAASVVLLASLVWLDSAGMIRERVSTLANPLGAAGTRLTILQDSARMFTAHPFLGWGLDVFPIAYPQYRTFATDFFVNQAHNDYLQVLVETGAFGFGMVIWFLYLLYRNALPHARDFTRDPKAAVRTAAMVACTGILVHSVSDFNLHIPANAALFFVLAAIASSADARSSRSASRAPRPQS